MAKTHSLFSLNSSPKSETNTKPEKLSIKNNTKQEKLSVGNNTKQELSESTTNTWYKSSNKLPDINRPIIINSDNKKLIHGYRLNNYSYIVDTPYYMDKFKQKYSYFEWQYIKGCINLNNCDRGFPNCTFCSFAKSLKK